MHNPFRVSPLAAAELISTKDFGQRSVKAILMASALAMAPLAAAQAQSTSARVDNGSGGPVVFGGEVQTHSIENDIRQMRTIVVNNGPGVITEGLPPASSSLTWTTAGGTGTGYADLASGRLGVYAASMPRGTVTSFASYGDILSFQIDGADETTITPIRAIISLHATSLQPGEAKVFGFGLGSAHSLWLFDSLAGPYYTDIGGFDRYETSFDGQTRTFDVTVNVLGAAPTLGFGMGLQANASGAGGVTDMAHTGSVRFDLGRNVTFSSASNVFLTAAGAVPEPSTWTMMIIGFGAAGSMIRRRKAVVA